jgi:hypothetical protein
MMVTTVDFRLREVSWSSPRITLRKMEMKRRARRRHQTMPLMVKRKKRRERARRQLKASQSKKSRKQHTLLKGPCNLARVHAPGKPLIVTDAGLILLVKPRLYKQMNVHKFCQSFSVQES